MIRRVLIAALLVIAVAAPAAWARDPITPLQDVHRGLHCTAYTVVQGTDIASFDVDVLDVVAALDGGAARILVHVSGPAVAATGVAEGFSGSPVYCPDANGTIGNAGAISATIGQYGNDVALVTPIEEMLGLDVTPPTGIRSAPKLLRAAHPLASPLVVAGLSPGLGQLLTQAAAKHGRTVVAAPAGPLGTFAPQPLVPGASFAVALASGDLAAGAIGTVTYRDGDVVYGFGHPLEGVGRRSLLLQDAYVFTVVANPLDLGIGPTSYKLAAPGHSLGTLTSDESAGVVGKVGALPPTIPLTIRAKDLDRNVTKKLDVALADETDIGSPDGPGMTPELASAAAAQGVILALDGAPAQETGHLCVRVRVRELTDPLRFCNRYLSNGGFGDGVPGIALSMMDDVGAALNAIDRARFAALHYKSISVSATAERGLRLATILSASGPHVVKAGHTAKLKLRVRLYRGPLRTIAVTTRIPHDIGAGQHALRIAGTPVQGGGDSFFDDLFGDGGGRGPGAPQTLRQVRQRFERVTSYDGVTARIGHEDWHLYRSDELRLDGHATLQLRVAGPHRHGGDAPSSLKLGNRTSK